MTVHAHQLMTKRLVDALYVEAMLLADEARSYFDDHGRAERDELSALLRVGFSCESLRVTTRLMHVIAWLLTRRAVDAGEISEAQAAAPERRLGRTQSADPDIVSSLPEAAREIIRTTGDLYARVQRLDEELSRREPAASPVRNMMDRLAQAF